MDALLKEVFCKKKKEKSGWTMRNEQKNKKKPQKLEESKTPKK